MKRVHKVPAIEVVTGFCVGEYRHPPACIPRRDGDRAIAAAKAKRERRAARNRTRLEGHEDALLSGLPVRRAE